LLRCNVAAAQRCCGATGLRRNGAAAQVVDEQQALRVIATIDSPAEAAQARCNAAQRSAVTYGLRALLVVKGGPSAAGRHSFVWCRS
jgi:hypothetical protein